LDALATLRQEARRLDAFTVFTSNDVRDVRDKVAHSICPLKLEVTGGSIDASLQRATIGDLSLFLLHYGAEVAVRPMALNNTVLLSFVLSGELEITSNNAQIVCHAGDALISEPLEGRRLAWSTDCEQLIIPLNRTAFVQAAELITGDVAPRNFGLTPFFPLQGVAGDSLTKLMQYTLLQATSGATGIAALEAPVSSLLAHHLLLNHSDAVRKKRTIFSSRVPYYVRQAELFMAENLEEDLSLKMIAEHARVSARTLIAGFRQCRAMSPIAKLRDIRLERARAQLLATHGCSVTEVALRFGFNHLGRFASIYRKRFGESPSATIARVRNEASFTRSIPGEAQTELLTARPAFMPEHGDPR